MFLRFNRNDSISAILGAKLHEHNICLFLHYNDIKFWRVPLKGPGKCSIVLWHFSSSTEKLMAFLFTDWSCQSLLEKVPVRFREWN